jgi:diguanylate cyclase (GGDEF)-like protein
MGIYTPISTLPMAAMGRFMPMYLAVDDTGRIRAMGPSLRRVLGRPSPLGRSLFEVMDIRRPSGITSMADLRKEAGVQLHLGLRAQSDVHLRGLAMPVGDGAMLINLSFGIGVIEAVRRYGLSAAHFAATDLTIELLYLVEAKAAVMGELRSLNARLNGEKLQAEEQALTDALTGLRNRRALEMLLNLMLDQEAPFGLMHLDLDYFKAVNDTLGHAAGDHVLREVAAVLRRETRATDTIARVGGDEFVLVMPNLTDLKQLRVIAQRLINSLSKPIVFEGQECRISGSIGMVASLDYGHLDMEKMAADADAALYAAKRAGRGRAHAPRQLRPPKALP